MPVPSRRHGHLAELDQLPRLPDGGPDIALLGAAHSTDLSALTPSAKAGKACGWASPDNASCRRSGRPFRVLSSPAPGGTLSAVRCGRVEVVFRLSREQLDPGLELSDRGLQVLCLLLLGLNILD
jgi:hypothetical protein